MFMEMDKDLSEMVSVDELKAPPTTGLKPLNHVVLGALNPRRPVPLSRV